MKEEERNWLAVGIILGMLIVLLAFGIGKVVVDCWERNREIDEGVRKIERYNKKVEYLEKNVEALIDLVEKQQKLLEVK